MSPAEMAGLMAGIEKVAYSDYISTGQYTSSRQQPPPPQTPEGHRRRTRRRAAALAAGLAVGGAAVLGRKHIARGARAAASRIRQSGAGKSISQKALGAGEKATIDKLKGAKSWADVGMDSARPRGRTLSQLGRAPVEGTPVGEHVKKEFAGMGMKPPPMQQSAEHATKKPGRLGRLGKAGIAATGATLLTGGGLVSGAAKGFGKRVKREEDDYQPGVPTSRG